MQGACSRAQGHIGQNQSPHFLLSPQLPPRAPTSRNTAIGWTLITGSPNPLLLPQGLPIFGGTQHISLYSWPHTLWNPSKPGVVATN